MAGYAGSNLLAGTQQAMTTSYKTLLIALAQTSGLRRFRVIEFIFGTDGTAADNSMVCDVSRATADGTSTSVTPTKLDPADGSPSLIMTANHTAEPTVTATSRVSGWGFNQRATQRWVAFPGKELVAPATNNAGFAFRLKSPQGYTGTGVCDIIIDE
jgi:hypothetical protein